MMNMNVDQIQLLARELNFNVRQHNGCRKFGPRRDLYKRFRPEAGSEVFVARLPPDAFEDEIYPFFANIGPIFKIKMILNINSTTKGYCFVEYMSPQLASLAVHKLHNSLFRPMQRIFVDLSTDHKKLLVSNTKDGVTVESIHMDTVFIEGLQVVTQVARNQFLLEFGEHSQALVAVKKLSVVVNQCWGQEATVMWEPNPIVEKRLDKKFQYQQRRFMASPVFDWDRPLNITLPVQCSAPENKWSPDSGLSSGKLSREESPTSEGVTSTANNDLSIVPDILMIKNSIAQEQNLPPTGPWYGDYGSGICKSQSKVGGSAAPGACNLPNSTQQVSIDSPRSSEVQKRRSPTIPPGFEHSLWKSDALPTNPGSAGDSFNSSGWRSTHNLQLVYATHVLAQDVYLLPGNLVLVPQHVPVYGQSSDEWIKKAMWIMSRNAEMTSHPSATRDSPAPSSSAQFPQYEVASAANKGGKPNFKHSLRNDALYPGYLPTASAYAAVPVAASSVYNTPAAANKGGKLNSKHSLQNDALYRGYLPTASAYTAVPVAASSVYNTPAAAKVGGKQNFKHSLQIDASNPNYRPIAATSSASPAVPVASSSVYDPRFDAFPANKNGRVAAGKSASTVTSQPSTEVNYEESAIPDEYRPKIKTAASGTTSKDTPSACFFNYGRAKEGAAISKELLVDKMLQLYQQNKYEQKNDKFNEGTKEFFAVLEQLTDLHLNQTNLQDADLS